MSTKQKRTKSEISRLAEVRRKRKLPTQNEAIFSVLLADKIDQKKGAIPPSVNKKRLQKKRIENLPPRERQKAIVNAQKSQVDAQIKDQAKAIVTLKETLTNKSLSTSELFSQWSAQVKAYDDRLAILTKRSEDIDAKIKVLESTPVVDDSQEAVNKADALDFSNDTHIRKTVENRVSLLRKNLDIMVDVDTAIKTNGTNESKAITNAREALITQFKDDLTKAAESLDALVAEQFGGMDSSQLKQEYAKRQDELVKMLTRTENDAPVWTNRLDADADTNKQLLSLRNARRDTLLTESAYLRAQQEPWIANLGGLYQVTKKDIDAFNQQKGLKIETNSELRALYKTMFLADFFVDNVKLNKAANQWDVFENSVKNGSKFNQQKFTANLESSVKEIDADGLILMNFSHVSEDSSWVTRQILNKVKKPGVIYIEAPYALNLHKNPEIAVGAWVNGAKTVFPASTYEVLVDAKAKGWQIVPIDATKILDGKLDIDLLKATTLPKSQDKAEHQISQENVPRQNYIGRNVLTHANSDHQTKRGGLVLIGGAHIVAQKGGNLAAVLGSKKGGTKSLTGPIKATTIKRNALRKQPDYSKSDPPKAKLKLSKANRITIQESVDTKRKKRLQGLARRLGTDIKTLLSTAGHDLVAAKAAGLI
jgi:hypothetical protein